MVNTSLFTGLAGLRSHQTFIDVIGSNLANVSTPGFRGSRVTFSDILSFTIQAGSSPSAQFGGTNPKQIGLGSSVGSIDTNTNQGTFQDTGRPLDVAIQGRGFFSLTDGLRNFYTRVGSFGVDAGRNLVDLRSGLRVQGASGANITVPVSDTLPAQPTTNVAFGGTLPATVTGPLEEIVQSSNPFLAGNPATKLATPPVGNTYDLSAFVPSGSVLVSVNGNSQQRISFSGGFADPAAATATEVAALFASVGSELAVTGDNVTGQITFDTVKLGDAATLKFDDDVSSTGLLGALGLNTTLVSGSQSPATLATDLAGMTMRQTPYATGDQIRVQGTNPDGTPYSATFVYGTDGTTMGDMVNFINGLIAPGTATATLDASGNFVVTATTKADANMSLHIGDVTTPANNDWPSFTVAQDGTGPDTAQASIDVVDTLGRSHAVGFTFTRDANDSAVWNIVASLDPADGVVNSDTINSIRFNPDGSFNVIGGGTNAFSFTFSNLTAAQTVTVNLGTSGQFDGVAMIGDTPTVAATDQDGFGPGSLLNVAFDNAGNMLGFYTNGQSRVINTLRLAVFPNEAGLLRSGDTMFVQSPNSDDAITTTAGSAGAGSIRPGSLENSNVDIAEEFVKLIEAQRGFQANSRVITTTDEILAELVNIVR